MIFSVKTNDLSTNTIVKVGSKYFRPCEVHLIFGYATKASQMLEWEQKYNLEN